MDAQQTSHDRTGMKRRSFFGYIAGGFLAGSFLPWVARAATTLRKPGKQLRVQPHPLAVPRTPKHPESHGR